MLPRILLLLALLLIILPAFVILSGTVSLGRDWRTADRSSAEIAPDPQGTAEAIVQVYAARAINWRGVFAVHTWIATKSENAQQFMVHQVIGWRLRRNLPTVASEPGIPDRKWFGNQPFILAELRGEPATRAIAQIMEAVATYPYTQEYKVWPGPNSNTFTAYVARRVPELRLELPVTAIGKDYPVNGSIVDRAPSGTGIQISLYGLLGVLLASQEGIELNLFGLSFGVDLHRPAIKLPFVGRLGIGES